MKSFILTLVLSLMIFSPAQAQDHHAHAQTVTDVEIIKITDNIHMLISPQGGNVIASTGKDGAFIIDDQLPGRSPIIAKALESISEQDLQFVLNTHYHFDHTGGNESFGATGAIIMSHDNVRQRLSEEQFITYFSKKMEPLSEAGLPLVTFSDAMTLHYNDDDIQIIHLPAAHTDGDAVAYFTKANVIVTGDTVFNNMYPFIDIEHGGSVEGLLKAQGKILTLANNETVILPGHGNVMTKAELERYHGVLTSITEAVQDSIDNEKTLEETIAAKLTQDYDQEINSGIVGPDAFVTLIYNDLKP